MIIPNETEEAFEKNNINSWLKKKKKKKLSGTSLLVQLLRLHSPSAEGPGSYPGQGTRSHILQLKDPACHCGD